MRFGSPVRPVLCHQGKGNFHKGPHSRSFSLPPSFSTFLSRLFARSLAHSPDQPANHPATATHPTTTLSISITECSALSPLYAINQKNFPDFFSRATPRRPLALPPSRFVSTLHSSPTSGKTNLILAAGVWLVKLFRIFHVPPSLSAESRYSGNRNKREYSVVRSGVNCVYHFLEEPRATRSNPRSG